MIEPYLRNQNLVASRHAHCYSLAILVHSTGSNSQNLGLVQVLDRAFGKEDASGGLGLCLHSLDQDTVEKRSERLDGLDRNAGLSEMLAMTATASITAETHHCEWFRV